MNEINDIRTIQDFRISSFSKYKKTEVSKELLKSLMHNKNENSVYWSVEMVCSGMFLELWTVIIKYICVHIYVANPSLPIYINKRIEDFKNILKNGYVDNELMLRNNKKIRTLFAEVIAIILSSNKKNKLSNVELESNDFTIHKMSTKFSAKDTFLIDKIYNKDDPKETYMAFNEFAYNLNKHNSLSSCYWAEWIIEYESICKKNKTVCKCERREFMKVQDKYQMSIIWILWELILEETKNKPKIYEKICKSLLDIFCLRYSLSNNKKLKGVIYYAIYLLCEKVDIDGSFVHNKDLVNMIVSKIEKFYKQIKNNEIAPKTDYLFKNVDTKSNREKTFEKLEIINNLN